MNLVRISAACVLALLALIALFPMVLVADSYDEQFRDHIDEPPGARFPLGTDELGRNRLARLIRGAGTSLLFAPAAAAVGVVLAMSAGLLAASGGSFVNRAFEYAVDLMSSLPWLFVLIAIRAMLPLDASPAAVNASTFGIMAALGWAAPARVIRSVALSAPGTLWFVQADASGLPTWRIWQRWVVPVVWPVAAAQVLVNIPVFVLSEANLGLLGLGVAEPAPSLGSLLRELENVHAVADKPWLLAPAGVLAVVLGCFSVLGQRREGRI
jgi:peptide/nickel transport system permease protein